MVLRGCLWLLAAYLVSRVSSLSFFVQETALDHRPTLWGWALTWAAIALGLLDLYFVFKGWGKVHQSASSFYNAGQVSWVSFVVYSAILSPFCEEAVIRGFLYRAFRGSYGIFVSTLLVLCIQVYFHWGLISHDWIALFLLLAGGILLCLIREYTGNSWNCVLFHAAYNTTVLRQWPVVIIGMIIALFFCARDARPREMHKAVIP